MPNLTNVKEKI
jgi:hypothetical protein